MRLGASETKRVTHELLVPSVCYPNCVILTILYIRTFALIIPLYMIYCTVIICLRYLSLENQDRVI